MTPETAESEEGETVKHSSCLKVQTGADSGAGPSPAWLESTQSSKTPNGKANQHGSVWLGAAKSASGKTLFLVDTDKEKNGAESALLLYGKQVGTHGNRDVCWSQQTWRRAGLGGGE